VETALITGSSRGLGLEWVRQLNTAGWRIHATCRHPAEAEELRALASAHSAVTIHRLDVTQQESIQALAMMLEGETIDVVINNAGVYFEKLLPDALGCLRYRDWETTFKVNTMGALRVTEAFIEHVARSQRRLIVGITSHMGSIAEIDGPGSYYYRSSKAALNAVMRGLSLELKPRGIGVLLLHPGWVHTRMGGSSAPLPATDSVAGMRELIEQFTLEDTGRFLRYNGTEIPW
jgi:NAD(P)-dependent dehydrogenase (short-subunit alcohol dehydrogenase family)